MAGVMPPKFLRPGDPGYRGPKPVVGSGPVGRNGIVPSPVQFHLPGSQVIDANGRKGAPQLLNVAGVQRFLRNRGYDIKVDGHLGPITKSAMADFFNPSKLGGAMAAALRGTHITGDRNPTAWNHRFGGPTTHDKVSLPRTQGLTPQGNEKNVVGNDGAGQQTISFHGGGLGNPSADMLPDAMAASGAQLLPKNLAEALAGNQFDTAIHDAQVSQQHQGADAKQNLADIHNWYQQVLDAQGKAATRDSAMNQAAQGSIGDANAAILASLGGGANDAAGMVAAQGQDNLGTLKALGSAQDQYNSDIAPLLKAQAAGASTAESARQSQLAAQLAQQVSDLMQQKGSAVAQNEMNIAQQNNAIRDQRLQNLLGIRNFNAQQKQQHFTNAMAVQQAKEAAILGGAKIAASMQSHAPKGSFASASPTDLQRAANGIAGRLIDPTTGQVRAGLTPAQARMQAMQMARVYFPNGGVPGGWLSSVVGSVLGG